MRAGLAEWAWHPSRMPAQVHIAGNLMTVFLLLSGIPWKWGILYAAVRTGGIKNKGEKNHDDVSEF